MYCIIEATDRHEASRGLSATAGLLVFSDASKITENVVHKYCLIKWIVKFLNKMYNKKRKKNRTISIGNYTHASALLASWQHPAMR